MIAKLSPKYCRKIEKRSQKVRKMAERSGKDCGKIGGKFVESKGKDPEKIDERRWRDRGEKPSLP
jgi:hypothetical protein